MKNNNNKKTKVALVIALIALVGTVGYGVYSRYFAKMERQGYKSVRISEFNPTVDGSFLTEAGGTDREYTWSGLSSVEDGTTTIYHIDEAAKATDTVTITNDGTNSFEITAEDLTAEYTSNAYSSSDANYINYDSNGLTVTCDDGNGNTSCIIAPGKSTTVTITSGLFTSNYGSEEALTEASNSDEGYVDGNLDFAYRLKATEVKKTN